MSYFTLYHVFVVFAALKSISKKGLSGGAVASIAIGNVAVMTLMTGFIF